MDLIAKTPADQRIAEIVQPVMAELGFELVRVRLWKSGRTKLQIMAERPGGGMNIDDCATLSRSLSSLLDAESMVGEELDVEVSSPGMDRPLTRPSDFATFAGTSVRVSTLQPVNGQRRFSGTLLGLEGEGEEQRITLRDQESSEISLPLASLETARIVPDIADYRDALARAGKDGG